MRLALVVNPAASSVTPTVQAAIVDALSVRHDLAVFETGARDDAARLAAEAVRGGAAVVVVLGGDGTLNEAVQSLAGTAAALAPLPGGSTNVFCRTVGLAYGPLEACGQLLPALDDAAARRRVGLGVATTGGRRRYFVFHLGVGFDAATVRGMEQRRAHLKRRFAHPAFAMTAVGTWLHGYDRSTPITVQAAGGNGIATTVTGPYAVVSNSDPYTYVGHLPVTIAPHAGLDRRLAVTVFRTLRADVVVRAAVSGLLGARYLATSIDVAQLADVDRVAVTADRPFPWQVDGDDLGDATELQIAYEPDALTLVEPRTPRGRRRGRR